MDKMHDVLRIAAAEVGYQEERDRRGRYNNGNKYARALKWPWADFQPWCASFLCWVFWQAGAFGLLSTASASCDELARGFKEAKRFNQSPRIGSLVFYGTPNDLSHVGIVTDYSDSVIQTIEGNTNDEGSREGHEVARRSRYRNSSYIVGYGHPAYPQPVRTPNLGAAATALRKAARYNKVPAARDAINDALAAVRRARRVVVKTRRGA